MASDAKSAQEEIFERIHTNGTLDALKSALILRDDHSAKALDLALASVSLDVIAFHGHPKMDILGALNFVVVNTFTSAGSPALVAWKVECVRKLLAAGMDARTPFVYRGNLVSTVHLLIFYAEGIYWADEMTPPRQQFTAAHFGSMLDALCEGGIDLNHRMQSGPIVDGGDIYPLELVLNRGMLLLAEAMASRGAKWRPTHTPGLNSARIAELPAVIQGAVIPD